MNTRHEQNILTFSACGALFFAALALVWGWLARSQMIMFDGIYSFISLMLTGLYSYAAWSIAKGRDKNFPFGRAQIEPMVVIIHSIVLVAICSKAFASAVTALFSGGQEMNNLAGMTYATIGVLGCLVSWHYIIRSGKKYVPNSALIRTLGLQWLMDTLLSLAVFIGFFVGFILQFAGYANYARYMDPLMVILAVLFFVREPLVNFIDSIRGILIMAPENNVFTASETALKEIAKKRGFSDVVLRLGKSGRELVYEIGFVADDPNSSCSVGQMDEIHREIEEKLKQMFDSQLWLKVSFVHDKNLA
jgi:predicted Co/Zn/Cd cation transporter (cation efflux family)